MPEKSKEAERLKENTEKSKDWHKWGPYLSERQWGTVREDYSADGNAWDYFPHDHARSRVYRWGEDGLGGFSDRHQEMCFAFAFWNGKDLILKERLFGLNGHEGNHGEDVKELYYYLDNTPTHSYMKMLYKYPQKAYPYDELVEINRKRTKAEREYELLDTGIFKENHYWDIFIEYAKADDEDILIKVSVFNRSKTAAEITILPTLWFRNRWMFGLFDTPPIIKLAEQEANYTRFQTEHTLMESYSMYFEKPEKILFTGNETNNERLFKSPNKDEFVKDAFHKAIINNDFDFLKDKTDGTKAAPYYDRKVEGEQSAVIKLRFCRGKLNMDPFADFDKMFSQRVSEADAFYDVVHGNNKNSEHRNIQRQSLAGLLWSKQYYNLNIEDWLNGDPTMPAPPASRLAGRNNDWKHLNNADIISMPDKWEYPWYAAWDLAFHCIPMTMVDPGFAKHQLLLIMREWYMQPNGQIPAYEWAFSDVNPPVHAWAALKIYEIDKKCNGTSDIDFLKRVFSKLLINFTWWVNRKDQYDNNIFEGGFLGLDNIGIFDRSNLPNNLELEQADGTSWMAMYAGNMLAMALEISLEDPTFEDVATKFYEHYVYISEAFNMFDANKKGLWNEEDGFFYDMAILPNGEKEQIRVRTIVGLTCLFGASIIKNKVFGSLKSFKQRLEWFRNYRLAKGKFHEIENYDPTKDVLLSIVPKQKLEKILTVMLDESEFLSDYGIRSVSKYYQDNYYSLKIANVEYGIGYEPGEANIGMFGGNSNWRGPIWVPMNYLMLEALDTYYEYYGDSFTVECPRHSGRFLTLRQVMLELCQRLLNKYLPNKDGYRPLHGKEPLYATDEHFKNLLLFYEYFHGDNGRGCGASHQSGWTSLISEYIDRLENA
jgi:hypothetical protein